MTWFAPWTWKRSPLVEGMLMLGFVGYPLSVGPAFWLTVHGWMSVTTLEAAYLPLTWLEDAIPILRDAERAYTGWLTPNN
jgi:hypothetical protein